MKSFATLATLAFAAVAQATLKLDHYAGPFTVGKSYDIEWTEDQSYDLELLVVKKGKKGSDISWVAKQHLFNHKEGNAPSGHYTWTLDESTPTGDNYALWLSGSDVANKSEGYADLSNYFTILPASSS